MPHPNTTPQQILTRYSDARILMTFLLDKNARPTPKDMKLWVDVLRFLKRGARGGALGFFTYMELSKYLSVQGMGVILLLTRFTSPSYMVPHFPPVPSGSFEMVRGLIKICCIELAKILFRSGCSSLCKAG